MRLIYNYLVQAGKWKLLLSTIISPNSSWVVKVETDIPLSVFRVQVEQEFPFQNCMKWNFGDKKNEFYVK